MQMEENVGIADTLRPRGQVPNLPRLHPLFRGNGGSGNPPPLFILWQISFSILPCILPFNFKEQIDKNLSKVKARIAMSLPQKNLKKAQNSTKNRSQMHVMTRIRNFGSQHQSAINVFLTKKKKKTSFM